MKVEISSDIEKYFANGKITGGCFSRNYTSGKPIDSIVRYNRGRGEPMLKGPQMCTKNLKNEGLAHPKKCEPHFMYVLRT